MKKTKAHFTFLSLSLKKFLIIFIGLSALLFLSSAFFVAIVKAQNENLPAENPPAQEQTSIDLSEPTMTVEPELTPEAVPTAEPTPPAPPPLTSAPEAAEEQSLSQIPEAKSPETLKPEQSQEALLDQQLKAEELGLNQPKILPDSPIYPVKNLWRGLKKTFTFNQVKKAELEIQYANEKIIETQILVEQKGDEAGQAVEKTLESYQKDLARASQRLKEVDGKVEHKISSGEKVLRKEVEEIKEKVAQLTDAGFKHQKALELIQEQMPEETKAKVEAIKELAIEQVAKTLIETADKATEIQETLELVVENQTGSEFKNFKNLEVLKKVEEKVPPTARFAIQQAEENTLKRFKQDFEQLDETKQEKFKNYVAQIQGNQVRHFEILHELEFEDMDTEMRQVIEAAKDKAVEKIEEKIKLFAPGQGATPFDPARMMGYLKGNDIEDLRIIKDLENNLPPDVVEKIRNVKEKAIDNFRQKIDEADLNGDGDQLLYELAKFHDVKQMEVLAEIEALVPEDSKELFAAAKEEIVDKMQTDIEQAKDIMEKKKKYEKLAGDLPEQIDIFKQFGPPPELMNEILREQINKMENKIERTQDAEKLQLFKKRIEEEEGVRQLLTEKNPEIFKNLAQKEQNLLTEITPEKALEQLEKARAELSQAKAEYETTTDPKITAQTPAPVLLKNAEIGILKAEKALEAEFWGQTFGQATRALHEANSVRRIIKEFSFRQEIETKRHQEMEEKIKKIQEELGIPPGPEEEMGEDREMMMAPMEPRGSEQTMPGEQAGQFYRPQIGPDMSLEQMKQEFLKMKKYQEEMQTKWRQQKQPEGMESQNLPSGFGPEQFASPAKRPIGAEKIEGLPDEIRSGVCKECPTVRDPVCAQGKTFRNRCFADCRGIEISHSGQCTGEDMSLPKSEESAEPEFKSTPEDKSFFDRIKDNFIKPPVDEGEFIPPSEWEEKQVEEKMPAPGFIYCTDHWQPVCGENGQTYTNACLAQKENVKIKHQGECDGEQTPADQIEFKTEQPNLLSPQEFMPDKAEPYPPEKFEERPEELQPPEYKMEEFNRSQEFYSPLNEFQAQEIPKEFMEAKPMQEMPMMEPAPIMPPQEQVQGIKNKRTATFENGLIKWYSTKGQVKAAKTQKIELNPFKSWAWQQVQSFGELMGDYWQMMGVI